MGNLVRLLCSLLVLLLSTPGASQEAPCTAMSIEIVDDATGRGVPMVELRTVHSSIHLTDSAGIVAFHEPGLMGRDVFFTITSDGYEYPADGFGFHGARVRVECGGSATLRIRRLQIAERLYRITGAGIYRDSVLLGRPVLLKHPLINARVVGQDSAQAIVHNGRIRWFWGDTSRPDYPLGNFATSAAVSLLPQAGGLSPAIGIDLEYLVDENGFSRGVVNDPQPGVKWIDGLAVLVDESGKQRLVGRSERLKDLGEPLERTFILWDDDAEEFRPNGVIPLTEKRHPQGRPFLHRVGDEDYLYFPIPFPHLRVRATWRDYHDVTAYEAFTCLAPGSSDDGTTTPTIERDTAGRVVWAWKRDTEPIRYARQQELIATGLLQPHEAWISIKDADTGAPVHLWGGTVDWNSYRLKYIMVANEMGGKLSFLGEIWFAEADAPEGPWHHARKIITHRQHSFYNPVHHPFFNEQDGRIIYLEGTYTDMFSSAVPTPYYNYNQVMYRLDLADERLKMPDLEPRPTEETHRD